MKHKRVIYSVNGLISEVFMDILLLENYVKRKYIDYEHWTKACVNIKPLVGNLWQAGRQLGSANDLLRP